MNIKIVQEKNNRREKTLYIIHKISYPHEYMCHIKYRNRKKRKIILSMFCKMNE